METIRLTNETYRCTRTICQTQRKTYWQRQARGCFCAEWWEKLLRKARFEGERWSRRVMIGSRDLEME